MTAVSSLSGAGQVLGVAGRSADGTRGWATEGGELDVQKKRSQPFKSTTVHGRPARLSHADESTTRGAECSDMTKGRGGH